MVLATRLSQRMGLIDDAYADRLVALIARAGLPVRAPVLDAAGNAARYLHLMRGDKKAEGGDIRFVLIDGNGQATLQGAPDDLVREVINACSATP